MNTDLSEVFFNKYFDLKNPVIRLTLNNGSEIEGKINAYFYGDENSKDPYILKWQIVDKDEKNIIGLDGFSDWIGKIIAQKDIKEVYFFEDNSILKF